MANPEAVMRAAKKPPMMGGEMGGMPPGGPMGGMPPAGGPEMPPKPPDAAGAPPAPPAAPAGGQDMDGMIQGLQGVGEFLQAQGPQAQEAMGHFQALLQSMATLGGGEAPGGPMPLTKNGDGPGRVHESRAPGVQVL